MRVTDHFYILTTAGVVNVFNVDAGGISLSSPSQLSIGGFQLGQEGLEPV